MPQSAFILIIILLWAGIITSILTARSATQALDRVLAYLVLLLITILIK